MDRSDRSSCDQTTIQRYRWLCYRTQGVFTPSHVCFVRGMGMSFWVHWINKVLSFFCSFARSFGVQYVILDHVYSSHKLLNLAWKLRLLKKSIKIPATPDYFFVCIATFGCFLCVPPYPVNFCACTATPELIKCYYIRYQGPLSDYKSVCHTIYIQFRCGLFCCCYIRGFVKSCQIQRPLCRWIGSTVDTIPKRRGII